MKKIIEVSNLTKKFNNDLALNKLNFSVHTGEIFGFLGPSGAGKTTTIKILTGQLSHDGGDITILGQTPNTFQKIANQVGVVSDTSGFYEKLSIYDNLLAYCKLFSVTRTRLNALLKQVNLYNHRKTIVEKASTGMKQRFLLVRAIIHQPKLLFLDEPTSGLDPTTTKKIHELLTNLKKSGTTIFLTTHNMHEATLLCDHLVLLNNGRLVEQGNPKNLIVKYNSEKKVTLTYKDGTNELIPFINLKTIDDFSRIETIHSCEPSLNDIFVTLTGGELND
ncbi:ABC transporter ATP-binding protein [Limosilactobacillus reuteri]|uniref:ABC transporter ATP-binding protein n=1 Tax=Limosilactobacillus reuteri TaxID=1598 RepID=UPI000B98DC23|nr:ABC transporter ATP-binding protein [Limosilactobacillus reuteri]OYS49002.1 ABC transporter ATP-binding protein [Limosilactobacillus reuteri]OYS49414.1 ABC transporter ATP-binding protein [Limosilactobacillus reuteri]OYS51194.1 ABC transporter ATP-binding protein [Limosilactobacillus reuteri]OYS52527.1 ABC transporter ATP-binding protein [Limosilactobacillus reuteri]OYS65815.1 ABC transporter ATP-binding protein [Limosilactobacillus reuteri]